MMYPKSGRKLRVVRCGRPLFYLGIHRLTIIKWHVEAARRLCVEIKSSMRHSHKMILNRPITEQC